MEKCREYLGSVQTYGIRGAGSNSTVHICDFYECPFLYKEIKSEDYSKFIKDKIIDLPEYFFDGKNKFAFPYTFIYKLPTDEYFKGYILEDLYNYGNLYAVSRENEIEVLKKSRDLIEEFHNKYRRLHADIYPGNFLYCSENNDVRLIDFDNNIDIKKKNVGDIKYYNDYAQEYIKKVGVDKDLDIFLYNLTVYSIMNFLDYHSSLQCIAKNDYGVFQNNEKAKSIFESYKCLENKKTLKKEYVIDYL